MIRTKNRPGIWSRGNVSFGRVFFSPCLSAGVNRLAGSFSHFRLRFGGLDQELHLGPHLADPHDAPGKGGPGEQTLVRPRLGTMSGFRFCRFWVKRCSGCQLGGRNDHLLPMEAAEWRVRLERGCEPRAVLQINTEPPKKKTCLEESPFFGRPLLGFHIHLQGSRR